VAPVRHPSLRTVVFSATAALGAGLVVVVARDGSAAWRVGRAVAVALLLLVALRGLRANRAGIRIATAIGLAAVAIPVGAGIGVPHLVKTGLSTPTVAGWVVGLGGVVLLVVASVWLLRALPWKAGVPGVAASVLAVLVLSWTLGPAVAATNVPPVDVGERDPADLGLVFHDVTFPATDGVRLSGWYVPSRNGAAVVLLHGAGSTRSNVLDHAGVLAGHGYGVLLYDARGHGRSAGRAMDFGWYGDVDVGGAVAFLRRQPDVAGGRIAAVGMSMGGEQAIGAAARIHDLRAVVAEGATNRVAGDKAWLSDEYGVRGALSEALAALTYGFTDLLTSASPPAPLRDAVAATPAPLLLIAAGDVADEAHAAASIRSGSPDTVDVWIARGAGHTGALETHPAEWERRVVSFLGGALDPHPAARR
jgi:dienelactone hydrolase